MTTIQPWTHTGYVVGFDARTSPKYRRKVRLRETARYYICESGMKFLKRSLLTPGNWPMYKLTDVTKIEPDDAKEGM